METITQNYISSKGSYNAWLPLDRLCTHDPLLAFKVILEILENSKDEEVIENLAAGPMEDLLVRNGKKIIQRIIEESHENKELRKLMGGVWKNEIDNSVWLEIEKIRGTDVW